MTATTLSDRALIRLSGQDVRGFLQGLVTNDVAGPLPVWAALLTAQGKCLFDFFVWADGDDILLDCEDARADALMKRLTLYRLRRPIAITPEPALAVHWSIPSLRHPHLRGDDDNLYMADPRLPAIGYRWLAPATDGDASAAYRAHRLALGVTEGVAELGDGETLWLECNAAELNGVSFTKGCYVGQENTARMNWRSTVNRRLCVVPLVDLDPKRQMAPYPDLGLSVEHRRIPDIPGHAWRDWMGDRAD
jgi:tRNA-modifying protein YgfZ